MLRIGRLVIGLVVAVFFLTLPGAMSAQEVQGLGVGGVEAARAGGGGGCEVECEDTIAPEIELITPASSTDEQYPLLEVAYCDNATLNTNTRWIKVNGVTKTSSFTFQHGNSGSMECFQTKGKDATTSVALNVGSNTVQVYMCDTSGNCTTSMFYVTRTGVPTVAINSPSTAINTRTPIVHVEFDPANTGSQNEINENSVSVTWGGVNVTGQGRFNKRLFEWEVSEALRLNPGSAKTLSVTVCNSASPAECTTKTRSVTLQSGNNSVISVTVNPFESLGRLSGASLGPFGIQGTEVVTAASTPAYVSMNSPRTAGLTYSSRQSYPRAVVNATIEFPIGTKPSSLNVRLLDGGVVKDQFTQSNPNCGTSATTLCWVSLQLPYATTSYPTPTRKWLKIESKATYGSTVYTSVDSMEVVMVDRRTTPYGSGWWPTGVMQLVTSGDDAIIVGSDGTATVFRGNDGQYLSPPGNYNVLSKSGSNWLLTFPEGGGSVTFNSNGSQTNITDSRNNQTTISYSHVPTRVNQITDPVGKKFTFNYTGDRITNITGPGGRQTLFSVNSSNRTMTSVSPPNPSGQNLTTTYGWNYTHSTYKSALLVWLQNSTGSGSRTRLSYNAALFPDSVNSPAVNNELGVLDSVTGQYYARELKGDGAAISMANAYAESRDGLNNWARSTLDRFGSPTKVWDAVGTVSRATYNQIGQVLSSEGKQGDSTRVYTEYDSQGRRLRSRKYNNVQSPVLITMDSVAYTGNSRRPTRVYDYLGNWTAFTYQNGQVTRTVTSFNDTTWTAYEANGQVDSTYSNRSDVSTSYSYDAVWKNTSAVTPSSGYPTYTSYDSYGRANETKSKISVSESTGGTTQIQWRRRVTFLNVVGGVDSVRVQRTNNCNDPCGTPSWPTLPDTIRTATTTNTFDSLGRVVSTDHPGGGAESETRTDYDVLGRVTKHWPAGYSLTHTYPSEEFKYDVAGRLRFQTTLRGHTFETRYDSRGRVTKRVLGSEYTYDYSYGGPNYELDSIGVASGFRDEVGGSHLNLAWVYNKSGSLDSDTVFTSSTKAWSNTHSYDTYQRPTQVASKRNTHVLPTNQLRYHAVRGTMDTLISDQVGRIAYGRDSENRLRGPWIDGSWTDFSRTQRWRDDGSLWEIDNDQGYEVGRWGSDEEIVIDSLVPEWTEKHGSGASQIVMADSMAYDGWQRLTRLDQRTGSSHAIQNFTYDNIGNLSIDGSWTFNGRNQITSTNSPNCSSFDYDDAGNMTKRVCVGVTWDYDYDVLNQLVEVKKNGAVIAEYTYNPLGNRVAEKVNGTIRRFVWRSGHLLYEVNDGGSLRREYTWGVGQNDLVAVRNWVVSGDTYYVVQDRMRSVRGLVKRNGTWAMSLRYRAYGEQSDSTGSVSFPLRFRWQGAMYDEATGLYYMNARYYDPQLGRFLTEDPIGRAGGSNLYAFVGGDPMSRRDPSGTDWSFDAQNDAAHRNAAILSGGIPDFDPTNSFGGWGQSFIDALVEYYEGDGFGWNGFFGGGGGSSGWLRAFGRQVQNSRVYPGAYVACRPVGSEPVSHCGLATVHRTRSRSRATADLFDYTIELLNVEGINVIDEIPAGQLNAGLYEFVRVSNHQPFDWPQISHGEYARLVEIGARNVRGGWAGYGYNLADSNRFVSNILSITGGWVLGEQVSPSIWAPGICAFPLSCAYP